MSRRALASSSSVFIRGEAGAIGLRAASLGAGVIANLVALHYSAGDLPPAQFGALVVLTNVLLVLQSIDLGVSVCFTNNQRGARGRQQGTLSWVAAAIAVSLVVGLPVIVLCGLTWMASGAISILDMILTFCGAVAGNTANLALVQFVGAGRAQAYYAMLRLSHSFSLG